MQREEVHLIVTERLAASQKQIDEFIRTEKESRLVVSNLLNRLVTVVAGDKEFNQTGLVQRVEELEKSVQEFQTIKAEIVASVRTLMVLGGALITAINVLIQLYHG